MSPQFPIIIKPSLLEQALTATPKSEPYQPPVIPSPGAKPKRFKTGLLVAQGVVFTVIALVPAFFGEFILAAVLLAATVGVILAQVNNQRVEYPRKLRIWAKGLGTGAGNPPALCRPHQGEAGAIFYSANLKGTSINS